jgi:hypothetical protein
METASRGWEAISQQIIANIELTGAEGRTGTDDLLIANYYSETRVGVSRKHARQVAFSSRKSHTGYS